MSELNTTHARANTRLHLLANVSALSLLAAVTSQAIAKDSDRPTLWIELGAQLDRIDGGQQLLAPHFATATPRPDFEDISALATQRLPRYGIDMDGRLSFQPKGSDWVFSAAIRYGRSNSNKHVHQQTPGVVTKGGLLQGMYTAPGKKMVALPARFDDTRAEHTESHAVLDFMAGKDVGLGLFGGGSVINAGVRFAQFSVKSGIKLQSNPDLHITHHGTGIKYAVADAHHSYFASQQSDRTFRGVGPSISWDASAPVLGNADAGEISVDWGVNGAVLFGRQTARSNHLTTGRYFNYNYPVGGHRTKSSYQLSGAHARSRSVVVPNVGGFAGLSFRYPNAKVSFGYRADMFFGVIDGGIDARKTYDRAFYGPFASVSIGLGG